MVIFSATVSSGDGYMHVGWKSVSKRMLSSPTASMRSGSLFRLFSNQNVAYRLLRKYSDGIFFSCELLRRVLGHLVVERLEDERDPAHAALHRHHLEVGVAVEHAREDQVGHDPGVADEQQRAPDGELGVLGVRIPGTCRRTSCR